MNPFSALRAWRRKRLANRFQVTDDQWSRVESGLPFLDFVPDADRPRLREMALVFLADKQMSGAGGFELDDEVRLAVALQASLPVLELGLERYAGWVGVIVYPGGFLVPRRQTDRAGVVHEYQDTVLGEAWMGGPVLLSWQADARNAHPHHNVVIHEFAHKLDMENGAVDGMPRLGVDMNRERWATALGSAYRDFRRYLRSGGDSWLDPYAAKSPAEFFAVISEAFFVTPLPLQEDLPEVYGQLCAFYRQDPAQAALRIEQAELA